MKIYRFFLISLFFLIFTHAPVVHAQNTPPIEADMSVHYIFDENGQSIVNTTIELTNTTTGQYAQTFQLEISGPPPSTVSASDDFGSIPVEVVKNGVNSILKLTFSHPVGGKGRSQKAVLTFSGPRAVQEDKIWAITLPPFSWPEFVKSSTVSISSPTAFGIPILTVPEPERAYTLKSGQKQITYVDPGQENIVVHYGHFQTYEFSLEYTINNPSSQTSTSTIHLPADSFEHQLNYQKITPEPVNIVADPNQSWDAVYSLPPKSSQTIVATGRVSAATDPTEFFKQFTPDVEINPAQYELDPQLPVVATWRKPWQYLPFIQNNFQLEIQNPNGKALYHVPVSVATNGFTLTNANPDLDIDTLPPFGKTLISLNFSPRILPPGNPRDISVNIAAHTITYNVLDSYVVVWYLLIVLSLAGLVVGLAIFAVKTGHLHLQKRRKNHHLHR